MTEPVRQKMVGYCRVSTEDKGQDPKRQEELLRRWGEVHGIDVVAVVLDEGTSGSVSPLARPKVRQAIELAKQHGADGIVVETADRWTRGGLEDGVMSRAALMQQHRLSVYCTDMNLGMDRMLSQIVLAIRDAMAAEWLRTHKARVAQGLRRAKERGWPKGRPGRPPKVPLTLEEIELVKGWVAVKPGIGKATLAHRISQQRGAFEVIDRKVAREREVSSWWLTRQMLAQGIDLRRKAHHGLVVSATPGISPSLTRWDGMTGEGVADVSSGGSKA